MGQDETIKTEYFSGSTIVSKHPCWLYAVIAQSAETSAKYLTLRNGQVSTSPEIMKLFASKYDNAVVVFNFPVYCDKGLYAEMETGVVGFTIQYKPEY